MADNRIPLSALARDPIVAAFFRRGERDLGDAFAVPAPREPVLTGGEAKSPARVLELVD